MTILHLECATAYGGSVRCLENFLDARSGSDRHVVCLYHELREKDRLTKRCDEVWMAPRRSLANRGPAGALADALRMARWFRAQLLREQIALVRVNNSPAAHLGAVLGTRWARVPYLAWLRSFPSRQERRWRWVLATTPLLVAVSDAVRRSFVELGIPPARVITMYDGTRLPGIVARPSAPPDDPRIGTLSRLVRWKGLLDFIRAAALVLGRFPRARFEIAGGEDPAEPGFKDELAREIQRLGIGASVGLRGYCDNPAEFITSLCCLVNPSAEPEPFGMSIVEAMAHCCPVVATATGGPLEIVEDGRSGLLVAPKDPNAISSAICRLLADEPMRIAMGAEARKRVAGRFELTRQTGRFEALFDALVRSRGRINRLSLASFDQKGSTAL